MHLEDISLEQAVTQLVMDNARESDQLSGLGFHKKFKKAFKKITRTATKIITKPVIVLNKKVIKSVVKGIKKAAPVALAATATFYGGPQAGMAVMSLASATSTNPKTAKKLAYGAAAMGIYGIGSSLYQQQQATNMATDKATGMLAAQGINMNSPAAQQVIKTYMAEKQAKIDREVVRQQEREIADFEKQQAAAYANANIPQSRAPSSGFDMKMILPIAAGVVAIPLLMR